MICLLVSLNAYGYDEKDHKVILDVVKACRAKHYPDYETKAAMLSNVNIEIPQFIFCNLIGGKECETDNK